MKQFQIKNLLKGTLVAALCLSSLSALAEDYDLTVAGVQVTDANADNVFSDDETNNGKVSFDPTTNTLTLNEGAVFTMTSSIPLVQSSLESLSIVLADGRCDVYWNNVPSAPAAVFVSAVDNATLTFKASNGGKLYINDDVTLYSGFAAPVYENNLIYNQNGDWSSIARPAAPNMYAESWEDNGNPTVAINSEIDGATISYSTDGETFTAYTEAFALTQPGTVYARVTVNGATSEDAVGKYFGFAQMAMTMTYGGQTATVPAITPALGENVEVEYSINDESVATLDGTTITAAGIGTTKLLAGFNMEEADFVKLNNVDMPLTVELTVLPPTPTVSLEGGSYNGPQLVELTSSDMPESEIHYFKEIDGVLQTDSVFYSGSIVIDQSMTLHVYQRAFDVQGNPFSSDTLTVDYTIRQAPGLTFIDEEQVESAIATIGETFTQPTLENENEVAVTYSSSNTNVATVATNGTVTLVGVGQTIIKAKSEQTDVWLADSAQYTLTVYKPLSHATVTINVAEATYPTLAPEVTVMDGESTILPKYYQVTYSNNTGATSVEDSPAPTVTITATELQAEINYYTGSATKTYTIAAQSITDFDISLSAESFEYNGAAQEPAVSFMEMGKAKEMTENVDYTLAYANNQNVGAAESETAPQVTIAGKGNYTGSVVKKFSITAKSLEGATIALSEDNFTYSGDSIKPAVTVTFVDAPVEISETDYTVSYTNNLNAATTDDSNPPTITVTGKGNFTGATSVSFDIDKADLAGVTIAAIENQTFTGDSIKPGVTVTFNDKAVAATEYDIAYTNNVNVSTEASATVTLTAKGVNFTSGTTKTASFNIVKVAATLTAAPAAMTGLTYTGEPQALVSGGSAAGGELQYSLNGTDYSADVPTGTDAQTYTVYYKVVGDSNHNDIDAASVEVTIAKAAITAVTLAETTLTYNGEEQTVAVSSVKAGELTLTADDYTVSGNTATTPGTYTVTVTAVADGNFSGSATADFTVSTKSIAGVSIADIAAQDYTGSAIEPVVSVTDGSTLLVLDTDYTVSYSNNVNAGDATVTITGKGNYDSGTTATKTFTISPVSLEGVVIAAIADQAYTGEAVEPAVTVTFNDKAVAADEYTVSYSNNTDAGEATVTLTSTGKNFTSGTTKTSTFQIVAVTSTLSGTDQTVTYDGTPQSYSNGSATAGTLVVTYYGSEADRSSGSNGSVESPVNAGIYYVRLTQGDANYASAPVDVTFTISPAAITAVTLAETTLTYNGEEQTVAVSSVKAGELTLTADDYTVSGNTATTPGTYTVTVTAVADGNYSGSATATFTIINRTVDVEEIAFAEGQTIASYYSTTEDLMLPAGLVVYIVTGVSGSAVITQAVSYIPKNVPVLVEKSDAAVEASEAVEGNLLHGTSEETAVNSITGGKVYVLYNNEFVKTVSGVIPANRCYLVLTDEQTTSSRLRIVRDDYSSGIEQLGIEAGTTNEVWYDQNGRMLNGKPSKRGLYLQRGKKVLVK